MSSENSLRDNLSGIGRAVFEAGSIPETQSLFEDILKSGADLRVKVTGRSMAPALKGGEIVTIRKAPASELHRGDIIFFKGIHGGHILHRVIRKKRCADGSQVFQTKGDAVLALDHPVGCDEVLGKVCRIEKEAPRMRPIDMDSFLQKKGNFLIAAIEFMRTGTYKTFCLLAGAIRTII